MTTLSGQQQPQGFSQLVVEVITLSQGFLGSVVVFSQDLFAGVALLIKGVFDHNAGLGLADTGS